MNIDTIESLAFEYGLVVRDAFAVSEDGSVPNEGDGTAARTMVLVGNTGDVRKVALRYVGLGWIAFNEGRLDVAQTLMLQAVEVEDRA